MITTPHFKEKGKIFESRTTFVLKQNNFWPILFKLVSSVISKKHPLDLSTSKFARGWRTELQDALYHTIYLHSTTKVQKQKICKCSLFSDSFFLARTQRSQGSHVLRRSSINWRVASIFQGHFTCWKLNLLHQTTASELSSSSSSSYPYPLASNWHILRETGKLCRHTTFASFLRGWQRFPWQEEQFPLRLFQVDCYLLPSLTTVFPIV